VKRAIGIPRHPYPAGEQAAYPQRARCRRAVTYTAHLFPTSTSTSDNFPLRRGAGRDGAGGCHAHDNVVNGELVVPPVAFSPWATTADDSLDSRYWGFVPRRNIEGTPLVIYWSFEAPTRRFDERNIGVDHIMDIPDPLLHQDTLVAHAEAGPRLSSEVKRSGCRRAHAQQASRFRPGEAAASAKRYN